MKKLLESKGYVLNRIAGSHAIFKKPGVLDQSIPVHHNKVKHVYYKKAEQAP